MIHTRRAGSAAADTRPISRGLLPRLALFVVATVVVLSGSSLPASAQVPDEQAQLDEARAAWEDRPTDSYTIEYRYCLGITGCHDQSLTFVDGVLVDGRDLDDGGEPFWTLDVDNLHRDVELALSEGAFLARGSYTDDGVPTDYMIKLFEVGNDDTTEFELISFAFASAELNELKATVTCLAGNGRIDVNIVNETASAATYTLRIGTLSPRSSVVQPNGWWRSPVTGRPDGFLPVIVERDGTEVLNETVQVRCDSVVDVSKPEVQLFTWCIGGNGIIFAQMANATASPRAYILDVNGIRRSTTAPAWGAAFRGISGRPDGVYLVEVISGGRSVTTEVVVVDC